MTKGHFTNTFYLHQRFLSKLLKEFVEELTVGRQNTLVGLKMVTIHNQGDVSKLALLSLFIRLVQDHFVMFRELLKGVHHQFGLHSQWVALARNTPSLLYAPVNLSCLAVLAPPGVKLAPHLPLNLNSASPSMSAGVPGTSLAQFQLPKVRTLRDQRAMALSLIVLHVAVLISQHHLLKRLFLLHFMLLPILSNTN